VSAAVGAVTGPRRGLSVGRFVRYVVLAGLIVPFQALIVPLFQEMKSFGLADNYLGIILPQIAAPIAVLVFKRAFDAATDPERLEVIPYAWWGNRGEPGMRVWIPVSP